MIFLQDEDISILPALSSRCSSASLAGTTEQRFSVCDEAKSSMHLREVSGDELTHLDEEVANTNCMSCGGFRLSAQRCYDRSATKMPHMHPDPRAPPTLPPTVRSAAPSPHLHCLHLCCHNNFVQSMVNHLQFMQLM